MATNTTIQQGYIDSATGNPIWLPLENGADWVEVWNVTNTLGTTQWAGTYFYWQFGMADDEAITYYHAAASQALSASSCLQGYNAAEYHGITPVNTSATPNYGASIAVTGVTAANPPLVQTGTTTDLIPNKSIVRLSGLTTGGQMCGIDFSIGAVVPTTSFSLAHMPQPVAGGTGFYRLINYPSLYYPRRRYITQVTAHAGNSVTLVTSVTNSFNIGESVRFVVPAAFGMTQLNGLQGTVTAVNQVGTTGNNTVTVALTVDATGFTNFVFPLAAAVPFTWAEIIPVGEDTAYALSQNTNILADSTYNTGWTGVVLGTDPSSAAIALGSAGGTAGDVIRWRAGSSFNNLVQPIPAVF
jgi:hypothetical protein